MEVGERMGHIANQLPPGNEQEDFDGVEALVVHGPSWTNWMPFDAHARSVVLPYLQEAGWHIRHSVGLARIDATTPWRPEVLK